MQKRAIILVGILGAIALIYTSMYSVTVVFAAPSSRITTSQGLTLDEVIAAYGTQSLREEKGLKNILVFTKGGGSLEVGNLQPNLRIDSVVDVTPQNKEVSFQYFVDIRDDLTGSRIFHCSDVRLHVLLDGKEIHVTDWLGYEDGDTSLALKTDKITIGKVSPGEHHVGLIPEGRVTGCNVQGYVLSWAGTIAIFDDPHH